MGGLDDFIHEFSKAASDAMKNIKKEISVHDIAHACAVEQLKMNKSFKEFCKERGREPDKDLMQALNDYTHQFSARIIGNLFMDDGESNFGDVLGGVLKSTLEKDKADGKKKDEDDKWDRIRKSFM